MTKRKEQYNEATDLTVSHEIRIRFNETDPLGIVWLREFLQKLASEGRTILVSSHQLAEMQNTVSDVLIINKGVLVAQGTIKEICKGRSLEEAFLELTLRKSA